MTPGKVIAVVGPSGVGKDSVMAGLVKAAPELQLVRRAITRAPELGGEDYDPLTEAAFENSVSQGDFCLHWAAHGLRYGIPKKTLTDARSGQSCLVNLSRAVLARAHDVFPDFTVLSLTARPETLAARLQGRGRETVDNIRMRLARSGAEIPNHLNVVTVSNDGPLSETIQAALTALHLQPTARLEPSE